MNDRWELPAREEPRHGASDVMFPWSQAQAALDNLDDLLDRLASYRNDDRYNLVSSLSDWEGPYRNEFNDVEDNYVTELDGMRTALEALGDDIVDHATEANLEQQARNDEAGEDQQAEEDGDGS